jgi:hypothetical protein
MTKFTFKSLIIIFFFATSCKVLAAVDYDIVYVKQPRFGDEVQIKWPEAFDPANVQMGSDLMLLHPDGSEEVLVKTKHGAVTDPYVSFDGKWVFYSLFHDVRRENLNSQRNSLPINGADIYKINIETRKTVRLTHQEFTPNTGSGNWDNKHPATPAKDKNALGYGILNLGAAPIAGNKIIFTSNRNGFKPTKSYTTTTMQLYVMDEDGSNVTAIAPMTLGSALHPTPLKDGRVVFSSYESQGLRDNRLWGLWSIYPDGRKWEPIVSAFGFASVFHFATQLSNGHLVVEDYYNKNNYGFGTLYGLPTELEDPSEPKFHGATREESPAIEENVYGDFRTFKLKFSPKGIYAVTPSATSSDRAASPGQGKYTHPSAAPNNDLLVAWSDGPVNALKRPWYLPAVDSGIYLIPNADKVYDANQLVLIKNDPDYNEAWPRAVVPYSRIHGVVEPVQLPWLPNDGVVYPQLPEGSAFGMVGTSSFYNRETTPGVQEPENRKFGALDQFNTSQNNKNSNWVVQGADAGIYSNEDIWAVRMLSMEPFSHKSYGPNAHHKRHHYFVNHAGERLRIMGEIPLRKWNDNGEPLLDYTGAPDTSFLVKIPADTPFTFQTLDKNGAVLNMSQTWHQVRPGEARYDCGGCHAHSSEPVEFERTFAASDDYQPIDLSLVTPLLTRDEEGNPSTKDITSAVVNVEFYQDIRPILESNCVSCHTQENSNQAAKLVLNDHTIEEDSLLPNDYRRLCNSTSGRFGIPPVVMIGNEGNKYPQWRQTNASRYVRKFQSRRSLLAWKLFGQRLDGWSNDDHPTEVIPGDPTSLPAGANPNNADLDYTGSIMPPLGTPPLNIDQKMTFIRWIDLGCPIDTSTGTKLAGFGWFLDETRPALTMTFPKAGRNEEALSRILVGMADAYTGINRDSLKISASFDIDDIVSGKDFSNKMEELSNGVYQLKLKTPIKQLKGGSLKVSIEDKQGNITQILRSFSIN